MSKVTIEPSEVVFKDGFREIKVRAGKFHDGQTYLTLDDECEEVTLTLPLLEAILNYFRPFTGILKEQPPF